MQVPNPMEVEVDRSSDTPGVAVFPPALFAGGLVLGSVLHWLRPIAVLPVVPARLLGLAVLLLSGALVRSAEAVMRRAGTNIRPDRPALALVTDGPFRVSRNPLYLATTGLYVAIALLIDTLWPLLLLPGVLLVLDWGVIRREERYLEAKFGDAYRVYRARVRRWI